MKQNTAICLICLLFALIVLMTSACAKIDSGAETHPDGASHESAAETSGAASIAAADSS